MRGSGSASKRGIYSMALLRSTCLLLFFNQAHGWITVSPEGNMTLMTTAQVGDWDHGTTGEPKDLYVTGDVHIGKTNGSLFVHGDIMVRLPSLICSAYVWLQ